MKDLFTEKISLNLLNIGLVIMFASPLFPIKIKPVAIGFFGLCVLLANFKNTLRFDKKFFFINASIYLLMILGLLYTQNIAYGFKKLETMSSLVIFPLIFSLFPKKILKSVFKNRYSYIFIYVVAVLIFNLVSFFYHSLHYGSSIFTHYITVNRIAQDGYNIHPIYLSLHICVALIFSFFLLRHFRSKTTKVLIMIIDLLLLIFLFIILKKGSIIVLALSSILFAVLHKQKKIIYVVAIMIILNSIVILSITKYSSKFSELLNIENVSSGQPSSTNIRYSIYQIAVSKIFESPLFGYGTGDFNDVLLEEYKKQSQILYNGKYNSHNQYISFTLSLGIVGLLVFIGFLVYNLRNAMVYKNKILIMLIFLYGLTMTFENILEREDGVILFSFFLSFFSLFSTTEIIDKSNIEETNQIKKE